MKKLSCVAKIVVPFVAAVAAMTPANAAAVNFDGKPIEVTWLYPTIDQTFLSPDRFVVQDGLVKSDPVGNLMQYSIGGNSIDFTFGFGQSFGGDFNGLRITDYMDALPDFTDVVLSSGVANLDQSHVTFDANNIWVNLSNVNWSGFQNVVTTLTVNPVVEAPAVPEPATWAMMIGGFGLVGAAMRRRKGAAVSLA